MRNACLVPGQVGRQLRDARLLEVAMQNLFLDRKINRSVRIDGEIMVVKRKHEGIDENYPAKTRITLQVVHGNAIRNSYLNANQIENLGKIILAPFLAQFIIPFVEPRRVLGGKV